MTLNDEKAEPKGLLTALDAFVFGPKPPEDLPARARASVARAQRAVEILITLLQSGAIVFFGAAYAITPKAFPPDAPFEPVPIVLAVYAGFTALRFHLALKDRVTPAVQYVSVVIDIAVLMVTIWSFHLQYEVSPAVYLKAPTLLYVFILIAIRAMRMDAPQVIFTGFCAAAGYSILVGYALEHSGKDAVTDDWSIYMTSATILIGAEIDKLIAILSVAAVLAIAVTRARRMLLIAAAERHAAEELSRFFPPQVANAIRAADLDKEGIGVRREAAVMMIDLRGFSAISERMSPRETLAILSEYQKRVVPIVHRHGGSIDKYLGDGVLATFGAIEERPTFAVNAAAALKDILIEAAAWETERRFRGDEAPQIVAALDVGRLTLGVVGADGRLEFTIIGDVVNRVAKLEKHARVLRARAIVSQRALDRIGDQRPDDLKIELRPAEPIPGLAAPLDIAVASILH